MLEYDLYKPEQDNEVETKEDEENYDFKPHSRLRRRLRDDSPILPIPESIIPFVEKQRDESFE
jgi:hypothetical protein